MILTCKDCKAFIAAEEEGDGTGVCVMNPPTVLTNGEEIVTTFPDVDGERMWCMKLVPKND
jgi:hypothetical protein